MTTSLSGFNYLEIFLFDINSTSSTPRILPGSVSLCDLNYWIPERYA